MAPQNLILYPKSFIPILVLSIIGVLAVGCRPQSTPGTITPVYTQVNVTKTISVTPEPSLAHLPTSTISKKKLGIPTKTTIAESIPGSNSNCPLVDESFEPILLTEGTIIFNNRLGNLYRISSSDQNLQPFLVEISGVLFPDSISPNQEWLALLDAQYDDKGNLLGQSLIVANNRLDKIIFPWDDRWVYNPLRWFDNQHLIIIPLAEASKGTITLVNPFTGLQQDIYNSFPDLFDSRFYRSHFWNSAHVVYDPTLTRAVYLSSDGQTSIVLWDVENERELFRFADLSMSDRQPVWSVDGEYFIFIAPVVNREEYFEFLKVSRDGQVERFVNQVFPYERTDILFNISPDGRFLSFVLGASGDEFRLMVVDLISQKQIDYCITDTGGQALPLWSPDSKQFIVYIFNSGYSLLVNIPTNTVTKLDIEGLPVGWLK